MITPDTIIALTGGMATLIAAIGGQIFSYQKLKLEIHERTREQTNTLTTTAANVAEVVATKLEQTETIHRLEISKANNFNVKIAKLEGQQEVMTRYLNALLHATGIKLEKEEPS